MVSCDHCKMNFKPGDEIVAVYHGAREKAVAGNTLHHDCFFAFMRKFGPEADRWHWETCVFLPRPEGCQAD